MRIVVASDSFKGSLTSGEIGRIATRVAAEVIPGAELVSLPVADGGEGTLAALVAATGAATHHTRVTGPVGGAVDAAWGLLPDGTAVVEMAAASGLPLVGATPNVMAATTRGTGELIAAALAAGARALMVTLGGSATNDGGMGALAALGVTFADADGRALPGCGADLARVATVDIAGLDSRIATGAVPVTLLCDVDNPLLGPDGATATFAPQKGADATAVAELEASMARYLRACEATLGVGATRAATAPGAGAAGGLGFALMAFTGARIAAGIDAVLDHVGFDEALTTADLVITGEGRLDAQTAHGKVVFGVAGRAAAAGVACVAVAGSVAPGVNTAALGLADAVACAPAGMSATEAMARAAELYAAAIRRVLIERALKADA